MTAQTVSERSILIVEDDEVTAALAARSLRRAQRTVRAARRVDEALRMLSEERFGIAIVDYRLEDGDAWPVLEAARAADPPIPVILVTASGSELVAAEAIHRGAADYVVKSAAMWDSLPGLVRRVERQAEIDDRHALLAAVVEHTDDGIVAGALDGRILSWNPAAARIFGYAADEVIGRSASVLLPEPDRGEMGAVLIAMRAGRRVATRDVARVRKDGSVVSVSESIAPIRNGAGDVVGIAVVVRDVSRQKALEAQLLHLQRLDAIGRLAGGVAHDFNNVLHVIGGYTEIAVTRCGPEDEIRHDLAQIAAAVERASGLTEKLLSFSRKESVSVTRLDAGEVVRAMTPMLRRLLGEDIALETVLAPSLRAVSYDAGQFEQIVMNLVTNARDAMPAGGRLTISTRNVVFDEAQAALRPDAQPGPYVVLTVTDSGIGMDEETLAHLFEPFFTTKGVSKGTGLGLATVHGVVAQAGGFVAVQSAPGRGSAFRVHLPAATGEPGDEVQRPADPVEPASPGGGGGAAATVLVAEDDPAIRSLVVRVLRAAGLRVLEAADGVHAMGVAQAESDTIDLLVTDVVMPGASGPELAARLSECRPAMQTVFMSGYTDSARNRLPPGARLVAKPFRLEHLVRVVREVLAKRAAAAPAGPDGPASDHPVWSGD